MNVWIYDAIGPTLLIISLVSLEPSLLFPGFPDFLTKAGTMRWKDEVTSSRLGDRNLHMSERNAHRFPVEVPSTLLQPIRSGPRSSVDQLDSRKEKLFCTYCGKSFISKNGLRHHMDSHRGNYRFSCEICGKGFQAKSNLAGHMNSHLNYKPHVCDICNKGFSFKFAAMRHKLDCHKNHAS